ncbi:MAG TPA: pyridoxal-dependent decarboxylase [Bacteroidia bacterium]|nr:pyridoxal-dependent decarboxylase [Bacteroidia bacterium]
MFWPKLHSEKIKSRVFEALSKNANYKSEEVLGIPGTYLDTEVFYDDAPFLKDAPFLSTLIANPNHIGCHTLGDEHEQMFSGTQDIEKEVIRICAEEIFHAEPHSYDGYIASGGTEANIEAIWIYRNYFVEQFNAKPDEIALIYSEDSHYSMHKAGNLLSLRSLVIAVNKDSREINLSDLERQIVNAIHHGTKYFIVILNMSTTMFGSVDDIEKIANLLNILRLNYKLHVDAAYGGFIYPLVNVESKYNFQNESISSISIDGHKMLQAPYGTGIFLIRKHLIQFVCNSKAQYIKGKDHTLVGSRSGANAVCLWMILHAHGSTGWTVNMNQLVERATEFCKKLDELKVDYYRNKFSNIIAIRSVFVSSHLAKRFYLVPDDHEGHPLWFKIVVMPHVKQNILNRFLNELAEDLKK